MDRIDDYVVERRLGAGGFATVWLAHDPNLGGHVAIKVLAENWAANETVRARFIDEAQVMHRENDPHFVRVLRAGELSTGQPYIVMEFADRGTLAERLARHEPLSVDEAVHLIERIADCARAVHDHGLVHRDIKPSNVLIRSVASVGQEVRPIASDERLLLGDFGLAKDVASASGFTHPGGSPGYMAPEQGRNSPVLDHRADIHALGVIAFELLTGRDLRQVELTEAGSLPAVSTQQPERAAFDGVVARAAAWDPNDRYDSVDAFLEDLRKAYGARGEPQTVVAAPTMPDLRRSRAWLAVLAGLVVAAVFGVLWWQSGDDEATFSAAPAAEPSDELVGPQLCDLLDVPAGALNGQLAEPAFCEVTAFDPDALSAVQGENSWTDSFDRAVDKMVFVDSTDYTTWLNIGRPGLFWRSGDQLLLDMESDATPGMALIRPTTRFDFDDQIVIEMDVAVGAAGMSDDQFISPEFVLVGDDGQQLSASSTALRSFFDQVAFGCSADPREVMWCELVDNALRDEENQGRIWRVSPTGLDGDASEAIQVGELTAVIRCAQQDSAGDCTNRYRVTLTRTSVRVDVNGQLLFEQVGLPSLPAALTDEALLVHFVGFNSGVDAETARLTFDRLAVNPE